MSPWDRLYRLQDWVLSALKHVDHGFYLTGGTALSRGYYQHRYSEDLDFFVNDQPDFEFWRDRCLDRLVRTAGADRKIETLLRDKRFGRAIVHGEADLKIEFINDVPFRVGTPVAHPDLGSIDTRENILANKITALVDRQAPKDAADLYWLCCVDGLSIKEAIASAEGKAAGIFPPLVSKRLMQATERGLPAVHWINPPKAKDFVSGLTALADALLSL